MSGLKQWGVRRPLTVIVALVLTCLVSPLVWSHGAEPIESAPDQLGQARLTEQSAPELRVMVLEGAPPGLLVSYHGTEPVTLMGMDGEPFLRFSPEGVSVRPDSTTWQAVQAQRGKPVRDALSGEWIRLSKTPRLAWMDPRLDPSGHKAMETKRWAIPVRRQQGSQAAIRGRFEWQPLEPVTHHTGAHASSVTQATGPS